MVEACLKSEGFVSSLNEGSLPLGQQLTFDLARAEGERYAEVLGPHSFQVHSPSYFDVDAFLPRRIKWV